jgi:hypothetical protein
MSERKVEKFKNHAIFWLHVTAYCLNMATSICFPHNVIDNGPIFTKQKPLHFVATAFFFCLQVAKFRPKYESFQRVYGISATVQNPMIWV